MAAGIADEIAVGDGFFLRLRQFREAVGPARCYPPARRRIDESDVAAFCQFDGFSSRIVGKAKEGDVGGFEAGADGIGSLRCSSAMGINSIS